MYAFILRKWKAGKVTADQVDLLVHTGYLSEADGEKIKNEVVVA